MRIVFLTASLEPFKDGVADYVYALAGEIEKLDGLECGFLALNDRHLSNTLENRAKNILRVPETIGWREKIKLARQFLGRFDPDWVSLQFVCFGWSRKGVPIGVAMIMPNLLKSYRVHIMVHELGLGLARQAFPKRRFIGLVQQYAVIKPLLRRLKPCAVDTSNASYQAVLKNNYATNAGVLPLFSNIPVARGVSGRWLYAQLRQQSIAITLENRSTYVVGGYFGKITSNSLNAHVIKTFHNRIPRDKTLLILWAGRANAEGMKAWQAVKEEFDGTVLFAYLDEQPAEKISEYLAELDFGIAATPMLLIGKSGIVAAMIEHSLPVFVPHDDFQFRLRQANKLIDSARIYSLGWFSYEKVMDDRRNRPGGNPTIGRGVTARLFIDRLGAASEI